MKATELLEQSSMLRELITAVERTNRNIPQTHPLWHSNNKRIAELKADFSEVQRKLDEMKSPTYGLQVQAKRAVEIASFELPKMDAEALCSELFTRGGDKRQLLLTAITDAHRVAAEAIAKAELLQRKVGSL